MTNPQSLFIGLRAEGKSFNAIAQELKVSKPTLIQWSKLFESEIKDLQFDTFVTIKESHAWSSRQKYETMLKQLGKIDDAILEADLTQSSIKDLFTVKTNLLMQLETMEKKISVDTKLNQTDDFGNVERLRLKLNEV